MTLSRAVSRFRQLSHAERLALAQALVLLPALHALVQVFGVRRAVTWANGLNPKRGKTTDKDSTSRALRLAQLVRAASRRGITSGNCLSQSLTLSWLLSRNGIASDLRIGVRRDKEQLQAHAWVELDGAPLNDRRNVQSYYTMFDTNILPHLTGWV